MFELIQRVDEKLLVWIGAHLRVRWLDPMLTAYTKLGNGGLIFIALAVLMLLFYRTRRAGASAGVGLAAGAVVTNLLVKPLVSRPRPWVVMPEWQPLLLSSDAHSFPSGHTTAAFAFAVALCVNIPHKWAKAAALAAAALMGFSRLYVGVHFPTDVLAGAVVGSVCGLLGGWSVRRISDGFCSRKAAE